MTRIVGPEVTDVLNRLIERAAAPAVRPGDILDEFRFEVPKCDLSNEELSRLIEKIASKLGRPVKLGE